MNKHLLAFLIVLLFSGCTQIITAPISIAGSVAGATIDVTSATVHAVIGGDD